MHGRFSNLKRHLEPFWIPSVSRSVSWIGADDFNEAAAAKRLLEERPAEANNRSEVGHRRLMAAWELYVSHGVPLRSHGDPQESTLAGLKFVRYVL